MFCCLLLYSILFLYFIPLYCCQFCYILLKRTAQEIMMMTSQIISHLLLHVSFSTYCTYLRELYGWQHRERSTNATNIWTIQCESFRGQPGAHLHCISLYHYQLQFLSCCLILTGMTLLNFSSRFSRVFCFVPFSCYFSFSLPLPFYLLLHPPDSSLISILPFVPSLLNLPPSHYFFPSSPSLF